MSFGFLKRAPLSQSRLNGLTRLINGQNAIMAGIAAALDNPDIQGLILKVQESRQQTDDIADELPEPEVDVGETGDAKRVENDSDEPKRRRRRLFQR